jgi:nucleoside-triphosphatase
MTNILITGFPGTGKTTLIERVLEKLEIKAIGFITKEIRENGQRTGFTIETLSGVKKVLAIKKNIKCHYRVGKYCVLLDNLDQIVQILEKEISDTMYQLIIIDEIGKMELFSNRFKEFLLESLEKKIVLGTIMLRDNAFTANIKKRNDVRYFQIDKGNREHIFKIICSIIKSNLNEN